MAQVGLTGKAQPVFQYLVTETQASLELALAALKERFEPSSQKTRYQAELQTLGRRKLRAGQAWQKTSSCIQTRCTLTWKIMQGRHSALNANLGLLDNPQVAFGVKQGTPANLDAAIAATLELESYLSHKAVFFSVKEEKITESEQIEAISVSNYKLVTLVDKLINTVEKFEAGSSEGIGKLFTRTGCQENGGVRQGWRENGLNTTTYRGIICWNCGKGRHIARWCKSRRKKLQELITHCNQS